MFVPVTLMGGVEMAVVQVIEVIAMGHGDMAAIRTVHMGMAGARVVVP